MPKVTLGAFPLTSVTNITQQHNHNQKCVCCGETHLPQHKGMDAWEKFVPMFRTSVDIKNQLCAGFAYSDVKKTEAGSQMWGSLRKRGIMICS